MRVQPFRGTTQYVPIVNAGELASSLSNAMQLANAYNGAGTFEGHANPNLRAIAASYPFRLTMGVKADKGIESLTQIKGLRMPTEYHTSRIAVTLNDAVLANAGLTRDDMTAVPVASFGESRKLMGQELVDLYLSVVGTGADAAIQQKIGKIRLLSFDDSPEAVAAMKKVIPVESTVAVVAASLAMPAA